MSNVTNINKNFAEWSALKPVYFPRWSWEKAMKHEPTKYSNHLPTYQGLRVILT